MVKLLITEADEEYLRLVAQGSRVASLSTSEGEAFYKKVTDGSVITFHYIQPETERSSLGSLLERKGIRFRGWYFPEGIDE